MEIRKLFAAGNSLVIAIPSDLVLYLGWKKGQQVLIQLLEGRKLSIEGVSERLQALVEMKEVENG